MLTGLFVTLEPDTLLERGGGRGREEGGVSDNTPHSSAPQGTQAGSTPSQDPPAVLSGSYL